MMLLLLLLLLQMLLLQRQMLLLHGGHLRGEIGSDLIGCVAGQRRATASAALVAVSRQCFAVVCVFAVAFRVVCWGFAINDIVCA